MSGLSGRCACGAVTWQSPGPVLWAGHCHCESCRRATSSPVTSFFGVPNDGLAWTGLVTARTSTQGVERGHCGVCGAQLYYRADKWPDETHLYAATLLDLTQFEPEAHYHWDERVPWLSVADDLPKHPGSADTSDPADETRLDKTGHQPGHIV